MAVGAREMKRRVTVYIGIIQQVCRAPRREGEQDLKASVVPPAAGLNDGVSPPIVPPSDAIRALLTQQVHNLGVPCRASYHQGGLLVFIQTDAVGFVAEGEEGPDDGEIAESAREVQRGVG